MMYRLALTVSLIALTACSNDDPRLEGTRISVRPAQNVETGAGVSQALSLSAPRVNTSWTHEGGSASHTIAHPSLGAGLRQVFSTDIGTGSTTGTRLTAGPVADATAVYTIDATGGVSATSPSGSRIWRRELAPAGESPTDGFGGGVSLGGGKLFATTGFGTVVALSPATGEILWDQSVSSPIRSAPTVAGSRVVVIGRDDVATAFDANSGQIAWQSTGARGVAGVLGGAQAAVAEGLVVLPFSSGEVQGVFSRNGRRAWATALTSGRRGLARSAIGDITGDPVVVGNTLIVANQSGSLISLDTRTGLRSWTHDNGAFDAVTVDGNAIWFVSDQAELIRLDLFTGEVVWRQQLLAADPRDSDIAARYSGPVLAGGLLYVGNGHNGIEIFDPASGDTRGTLTVAGGIASAPAVANNRMYVLSNTGSLIAFE